MNVLNDGEKLEAIKTFLQWDLTDTSIAHEALDQIWWIVMEERFKPLDEIKKGN